MKKFPPSFWRFKNLNESIIRRFHLIFHSSILVLLLFIHASLFSQTLDKSVQIVNLPPKLFLGTAIDTSQWIISDSTVFTPDGKPVNRFASELLLKLERSSGAGLSVSCQEFRQLLRRHTDPRVYAKQLIKYATPKSKEIQDNDHARLQKRLMKDAKLRTGVRFMFEHAAILKQVQLKYQVHPKDVVGILMWESGLGKYTGKFRIFNIFMGQILFLDKAEQFAITEMRAQSDTIVQSTIQQKKRLNRIRKNSVKNLAILLRIAKEYGFDALEQYGSWGGAIGYAQFMPTSLKFAVDGDGNGIIDLYSWPDAIYSVANYLKQAGYGEKSRARRRAIFAYNRLNSYVNGVVQYADAMWARFTKKKALLEKLNAESY